MKKFLELQELKKLCEQCYLEHANSCIEPLLIGGCTINNNIIGCLIVERKLEDV